MRALLLLAVVSAAAAAGGFLRAFHASPDAPAVNIVVNNATAITSLTYPGASAFLPLANGRYEVKIVPTSSPSTTVLQAVLFVGDGLKVTAVARGFLADIRLDVFVAFADPAPTRGCAVRVTHLSPDAPAVNILVNGTVALRGVVFPEFVPPFGHLFLRQDSYQVSVEVASSGTPVLSTRYVCTDGHEQTVAVVGTVRAGSPPLAFYILNDNTP